MLYLLGKYGTTSWLIVFLSSYIGIGIFDIIGRSLCILTVPYKIVTDYFG